MNWLDIVILIPLLWGLYKGFSKGLIMEAANIVAFALAVFLSVQLGDFTERFIRKTFDVHWDYLPVVSFAIIFIGVLIAVFALAKLLAKLIEGASLSFLNKILGGLFGCFKFALILSVLFFMLDAIQADYGIIPQEHKKGSLLYEPIAVVAPASIPSLSTSTVGHKRAIIWSDSTKVSD